jgi:hypothetical protein
MRIDEVRTWWGNEDRVPAWLRGKTAPFEISEAQLDELSQLFDVAVMHHRQPQPTKHERSQGAKPVPDLRVLWLDDVGGKFRQR